MRRNRHASFDEPSKAKIVFLILGVIAAFAVGFFSAYYIIQLINMFF